MRRIGWGQAILWGSWLAGAFAIQPKVAIAQEAAGLSQTAPQASEQVDLAAMGRLLQQLQSQVAQLNGQVKTLQTQQESARAESVELRKELDATKSQLVALSSQPAVLHTAQTASSADPVPQATIEDRVAKLEESQQLVSAEVAEQSQTKVESASKYRVRLTGMLLFNMYANRGSVDNQDFPQLATPRNILASDGTFGATGRQSQIGLEGFGPTIAGARTSAEVQFDFAGGFPDAPNGVSFGIMRLRTGTVRFDWDNTSIIAGQDTLFLSPLSPTSIATIATPSLSYSGNLWSWTPQVRVEHRFTVSQNSSLLLQGGLLDSLSGDMPPSQYYRYPSPGENSGQPAYATRLAWTHSVNGQNLTLGAGGYYARQNLGYSRTVDSWAATGDVTVPLGTHFEFDGEFYRGRATGGLGGGIGQSVLWNTSFINPATELYGLDSIGGWAQLKYKATSKLQFNGAFGQDNPFAGELRQFGSNQTYYYPSPLSKNQTALVNFLYQPKSDIVFSLEYRRLRTYVLDANANQANVINLSVGYIF